MDQPVLEEQAKLEKAHFFEGKKSIAPKQQKGKMSFSKPNLISI